MATNEEIYALLLKVSDSLGATEGIGGGYGDSDADGYGDPYATYGEGETNSLYAEVLDLKAFVRERLDVPVSSREPVMTEPGQGSYYIGRIVKDDTATHTPIQNALVQGKYSGTSEVIVSTRTNTLGKFVLFFNSERPMDITITHDSYQGSALYGVIPQAV
jgi:hypothetical protein